MSEQYALLAPWIEEQTGRKNAHVVKALSGGNSNITLMVETSEGPLVMRTPPVDTISPRAHRGVEREAQIMGALAGHAPVPGVLAWCADTNVIGRPFALIDFVDGVAIADELPRAYDGVNAVNALGEQLTDALAAIAVAPWQELGLERFGNPDRFLQRQIERWLAVREQSSVRELPQVQKLGQWLLENVPADAVTGVVHGDYHLDNTLCAHTEPRLLAVIDWEMASIGDPLSDLGLFLMFWGPQRAMDPPGFAHVQAVTRAQGVTSRRELAQRWAAATGVSITNLDYYLCFAFWRLAAIVEGAYCLFAQGKVDTPYARGLEYDVPALLQEAEQAAGGNW
tara:strand:- start:22936 stop:23952 length:1017 start_codon:yes stop_codon:yes gene_type:complete